jgi:hypothetical protein
MFVRCLSVREQCFIKVDPSMFGVASSSPSQPSFVLVDLLAVPVDEQGYDIKEVRNVVKMSKENVHGSK